MKTTLMIPDPIYRRLKQRAAAGRRTVSSLVAELLDSGLRTDASGGSGRELPPLPSFDLGQARVDVADRDALHRAMDGHVPG
ncbi:MAG: hypothetical protein ACRD1E_05020 [Terriglobales bacterium]